MSGPFSFDVILSDSYASVVDKVIAALKAESFGVIARIDVRAIIKEKLGLEYRPYLILGACNPALAHRALQSDPAVGLLLPCNVTIDEREDGVHVAIANPEVLLSGVPLDSPGLRKVAEAARVKLERVSKALE